MQPEKARDEMDRILFMNLVMMLSTSALQQLGQVPDPVSNQAAVNIEGAQLSIDMLEMIRRRTDGNLPADEKKMIDATLAQLQMVYVQAAGRTPADGEPAAAEAEAAPASPPPAGREPPPPAADAGKGAKQPKFHKSYGA